MKTSTSYRLTAISLVYFLLLLLLPATMQAQTWYNNSWLYRKVITIDYTKVGAGPHTNFPVLINMTDANLQAGAQADADDILFTSSDGTTKISHEIENYTSASGAIVAWVEIPSLSSSANTVIYMYYGNAAATSQQDRTGTWDATFKGVYHLNTAFADATSNAFNGTNTGTTDVTGKISQGRGFDPSNGVDKITITGLMGSSANITLSGWGNLTTADVNGAHLVSLGDHAGLVLDDAAKSTSGFFYSGAWNFASSLPATNYAATGWHYFVYTFDDAGNAQVIYVDGVSKGTSAFTPSINYAGLTANTIIGTHANGATTYDFDGAIDEVRVANTPRSAGWILTEYNNQNSPSTFYSVGTQTTTRTFTGTGNFSDATKWTGSILPVAGDNLIIDGACTVDNAAGTDNIAYGTLTIGTATGRTLNWAASGTNRLNVSNVSAAAGASTLSMTNGGTLIIRGTWTSTNLTFTPGAGTIEIQSTITLPAAYATYNNLKINGPAQIVTTGVGTTINNNLTVTNGTFTAGAFSLGVTGTTSITGAMNITSATGAKSFGNLVINSGGVFTNTTANVPITIAGNLQNDGTFSQGTGRVTFTGATSNTVTGIAATTAFGGGITIDKGTANTNVLDVQSVITMSAGGLILINGTFKLSSNSTITPFIADIITAPYLIPATAGLWVNGGTITSTSDVTFAGLLRVSNGILNAGDAAEEKLRVVNGASVIIDGGTVNVAGRFTYLNTADVITFTMSSGTFTVPTMGSTATSVAPFHINQPASSFNMSGGTIIIQNSGGTAGQNTGFNNSATAGTGFTAGTLQIGNASTPAGKIIEINSANAVYNLTVNSSNVTARLISALTVTNDLTITTGVLNANSLGITVGGNWINNASTIAFTPGTGTVTFNSTGTSIGGSFATTFNGFTMNRASGVTLGANITVGATLTLTSGNITTGSNNIYLNSTGTVSRTSGHVIGNFKKYIATGPANPTFEIGNAGNYTPVSILFGNVTTAGDLTASTAAGDHANIASSTIVTTKTANRTWTLTNSGILFTTYSPTFTFVAGDLDGGATTSNFIVGQYSSGWIYPAVGTKTSTTTQATGLTGFGDFQVGENCSAPTTSAAGADQTGVTTCGLTSVTLAANTPTTGTGAWSIVSGTGGTVTTPSSATSTFTGTAATTYTLRWTISNSPCTASTDDVVITFNRSPTTSAAGADQTGAATCGITLVTLAANVPAIGTGVWSIVSGAGGTVNSPSSATSTFIGTAGTTYTLRWTISNSPCTASTDDVVITFNRNPTVSAAGADQTGAATCGLTTVTLAGNTPTIGTGAWSIVSGAGGTVTTPASATSTFTGTAGTSYTLRWTISNSPCTASTDDVVITFNPNPTIANAGADQTSIATCGLTSVTLAGNAPSIGTGAWSIVSGAGGTVTTPASATSTFTGTAGTTYTLRWTISNSPCTASTDDVVITFNQNPTTANAGADQAGAATCGLTSVTLAGNAPSIGTGAWSIISGVGGTVTTPASATSTFTGTAGTTYTLRWTISNSPCTASTDDVIITFNRNPTASAAGADQTGAATCGLTIVTLAGNTPTIGTGAWSIISGAGGTVTTPASATSTFTGTAGTTYTLRWTISNSPCTASTDDVVITFNRNPTVSAAGADQTGAATCGLTTVTLAGNTPTIGTGAWSIVSGAGGTVTTPASATSTFTGTAGTTYTLRWTISNSPCTASTDDVVITFNPNPTIANAGADQTSIATCGLTSVTLAGNVPGTGTGAWSIVSGAGGTVTIPASATSTFTGTAGTTYTLRWTISNSPCTASTDDVVITFNQNPTTANAGADQNSIATCGLTSVTLAGNAPSIGTGAWSIISGAGGTVTTPSSATSTFTGTAGTSYTLRWTISNSPCTASTDDVVITFNRNPTASAAGADQTGAATCGLTTVTLAGNTPTIGTGAWSIISGAGGTVTTPASATSTFTGTAGTSYTLRWTISNSPCTASTDDVIITFNRNPTVANAGADQTSIATCGLTSVTLAGNTPTTGTGAWSIISGAGGTVTTPASATSTFTGTAGTSYTLRWTISNSPCTASTDDVVITFNKNPTTANAGADQNSIATCGLTSVTLAGNAPTIGTGAWSIISGAGGTVTTPASGTSTFTGTAGTTYTLRWTISNSPCTASTDDVVITFNQNPTIANAGADQTSVATCGLTSVTLAGNVPGTGTGAWSIISGAGGTVTTPSGATSNFSGTTGTTYTLRWTISNSPCSASTDDVIITFNQNPAATISFTGTPYCSNAGTATVTFSGTTGGTYTSTAGLTINSVTGDITLASSTAGLYTVTYTMVNGPCTTTATTSVTITALPAAAISYSGTPFCNSVGSGQAVTQTGTAGGAYTSTAGLTINASTGAITPGTSTAGAYTVTYTMAATGGCTAQTATTSVTITALPSATISYSGTPFCKSLGVGQAVTQTGTTGGNYSSTAGLTIDISTGVIIPGTSVAGAYTVTYTMAANGCADQTATTSITITAIPAATISYAGSPYFVTAGTATVTFSGTTGGTYSSTAGLTINATTGDVTLSSSTPGTYTVTYSVAGAGGCSLYTTTASITVVVTTKTFTGTGNFSDPARWTSGTLPNAGENLVIDGACTVDNSVTTDNVAYGTLQIGTATGRTIAWAASGTNRLNVTNVSAGSAASTLNMTNGGTLIIRGTWASTNLTFTSGAGTIDVRSTITLPAAYASYRNLIINGSGITVKEGVGTTVNGNITITAGTLSTNNFNLFVKGDLTNNVSTTAFTAGTATVNFTGTTAQTIGGTFATTFTNLTIANTVSTVTLTSNVSITGNLSVTVGIFDLGSFTANRATAGGTFSLSNNTFLRIGGTNTFPTNYTTNTLVVASTVEYYGTNQTVANQTYGNLTLSSSSGAAIKTFSATAFTIAGNLTSTLGAGTSVTFTAASILTIAGNVSIGASTTFNGGSFSHSVAGNWVNSGTFNGNTGAITFSGPGKGISGPGTQDFNNLTVSASLFTFSNGSISLSGNLATLSSGSLIQAADGILLMTGTGKTISGTGISLDNLTVSGTVTTAASFSLTGNLSVSGSITASSGSITMNGASKTISGAGTIAFAGLLVPGSVTTAASFSISNSLSVTGSLSASAGTATFTGTSSLSGTANLFNTTINGTSFQLTANSMLGVANAMTITSGVLNVTSSTPNTVNFNGSGTQNINAISYNNLVLSNGNTKTAAGAITINKDITIATGTSFAASSYTHSIYGNWTNNGIFIASTCTVQFLGPATAYLTGVTTFNILTSNTSSASTELILNDNIAASIVNMTNGIIRTGTDTITIASTRTGNGFIYGNIQRNHAFTTGVAYAFEGPDNTISFSAVSGVNSITVTAVQAAVGDFPFGNAIGRYYNIAVPSGTYTATLRLHYEDEELNGNPEDDMGMWNYDTTQQWIPVGKTANDSIANYVEHSGLTNITNRWTCSINPTVVLWNGSVSADWNTAANWTVYVGSGSTPPAATDVVVLGGLAFTYQPTISTTVNIKNLVFVAEQEVTLTMAGGGSLTAGDMQGVWYNDALHTINTNGQPFSINGNALLSDGVTNHAIDLNIGSGTVNVLGSLVQTGGANINFSSAGTLNIHQNFDHSSGAFTAGSGTVNYNGDQNQQVANVNYNNLTINKTAGLATIDSVVNIAGNLLISNGELNNNSTTTIAGNVTIASGANLQNNYMLHVGGNWLNAGTFVGAGAHVVFNGSGTQTISATTFNNLVINKPVGSVAELTGNIAINGDLTVTSGTLNVKSFTCDRIIQGGTFTLADSATYIIGGNNAPFNFTSGAVASSSTVIADGTDPQAIFGENFGNLIFRNPGLKTLISPISVNGNLTIENGSNFNAGAQTLTLKGNWINNGTFTPSTSTIICTGIGKTISGVTTFKRFSVYGSYTLLSNITFDSLLAVNAGGEFYAGSNILVTMNGDLVNSGILYTLGTTTFTGNVLQTLSLINAVQTVAITVNFNGSVSPVLNSTAPPQYGYLTINNTAGINPSVGWTILYAMTVGSGASFNGGNSTHTIMGNLTNNGTITSSGNLDFTPATAATVNLGSGFSSTGNVVLGGAGALTLAGTPNSFYNVRVSNTNAAGINPVSDWTLTNQLFVNSGATLNAGNHHYFIGGNVTNQGTVNSGTSTFTFNGATNQTAAAMAFYNLDAANTGSRLTLLDATVNNNLSVTTGTLSIGNNEIPRTLMVNGNITIASGTTLNVDTTSTATHLLTVSGDIINNGTLNLRPDANSLCNVTFNKVGTQTISGTGAATSFNNITVNKGVVDTSHLDVTATNFSAPTGFLTLSNGSFNLNSAAAVVTPFTSDISTGNFLIPATAGLWVNAGTINSSAMNWTVAGSVKVTGGTMNMGSGMDNAVIPQGTGNFLVTAGNLNLASRISNPGAAWSLGMQGGTMTVNTQGSTAAGVAAFNMDATGSSFNMSGGTLIIKDAGGSAGQNLAYNNLSTAGTGFTGGTLQMGNILTTASQVLGMVSTRPIYNLTVNSANATAILQTPVLAVSNNVTVTLGTLNIDSLTLKIGGAISNSGTFTASRGTIEMNGTSAQTIPAAAFSGNNLKGFTINNNAGVTLAGAINLTDVLTVSNGSLASDGYLTLKSSATATARVGPITSIAATPISGNVIAERYVPGRRKYRLITSPVTTSASSVLTAGQESLSIWGHWQNSGINTNPLVGNFITGGSAADGFDQQTTNNSLFTYDDVNKRYVGYSTANGKNTKYTPLKAGVAYFMFVYGDRMNSISTSTPHNTVISSKGLLKTGNQVYTTGSAIPLSGVTGRFTLLGNPFASPIDWSTIVKTDLENTFWGWDPNLSSTGGYITVTTLGNVTLIAPFSGSTGLNQHIQSGQGFFVKTSGPSPVLTLREQDKVSNFNGNAFRVTRTLSDITLLAINLQYAGGTGKILADGVLAVFDSSFAKKAGAEDAVKMPNLAENVSILNDTTSLSLDARPMPNNNDTLYLNTARLTKPQYTLQIFSQQMAGGSVQAYLHDRYLNTVQALSLTDTNRIVINVNAGIPASSDISRFRIVFHSSVVALPVTYTSIKATKQNKDIRVDWEVAEESGIEKYEVERSGDGIHFSKVAEVTARGNNSSESYHWLDVNTLAGNNYYRVRAIELDGKFLVSKIVVVKMTSANAGFTIYPNPVKNYQINIRSDEMEKGEYTLVVFNPQGQQIVHRVMDHAGGAFNHSINLSKTSLSGIYFLQITGEKETWRKTIFLE